MGAVPNLDRGQARHSIINPPLDRTLGPLREDIALGLFRSGLDTVDIARELKCLPAAAANALARARDREHAR